MSQESPRPGIELVPQLNELSDNIKGCNNDKDFRKTVIQLLPYLQHLSLEQLPYVPELSSAISNYNPRTVLFFISSLIPSIFFFTYPFHETILP